jgi:superfamily II RNA helicase
VKRDTRHVRELRENFLSGIGTPERQQFCADEFQLEAIQALEEGCDTLVVAPTGAGKTYIAIEAIKRVAHSGERAVYTAPLKALSNSKYTEFRANFGHMFGVGLLTGDRKLDGDAEVIVATTEIYRNELYRYAENYRLVVLDELHYIADPQRGPVWEESIILSPRSATLLMLSASISNPEEIADWIESVRHKPVRIIRVKERPVELRLGFLHPELGVLPLADKKGESLKYVKEYYAGQGNSRGRRGVNRSGTRRRGENQRPRKKR